VNPEVKTKWVAALRSGEYKQGRGLLRNGAGQYCCLGVLCEIQGVPRAKAGFQFDGDVERAYMPSHAFLNGLGLYLQADTVAHMNDDLEHSFSEIADYIEKNL
jgi:hypothetical protein